MNTKSTAAAGFALMLETACEDFEIMQRLISGELAVVSQGSKRDVRASPRIQMALAKSFVFHVVRARRICEHSASSLAASRVERKRFMAATAGALSIRDVNEHGFESNTNSPPSLHFHDVAGGAFCDETAMTVLGSKDILMGGLNLFDLYGPTDRMRKLAGFFALAKSQASSDDALRLFPLGDR